MKTMYTRVIFLSLIHMAIFAMDNQKKDISPPFAVAIKKTNYRSFTDLTRNNAALLKRLVAQEKLMYCQQLARAEEILAQDLSKKNKDKKWRKECDPEAVAFVLLIARKKDDCNRLLAAMDSKDILAVENIVHANPHVVNHYFVQDQWEGNITPLHYVFFHAAYDKNYEIYMNLLLRAGANPNAVDGDKNTLMHKALNPAHVDLLWKYGAASDETNKWRHTPLMTAIVKQRPLVASYLIANIVDLTAQDLYGCTPLHLAIFHNNSFIVKKLLKRDAPFEVVDSQDKSAAYYASKKLELKGVMNPYIQRKLWQALCTEDEFIIAQLINNNPWMDYMLQGRPLMKWVKEQCSDKIIIFFEKVLTEAFHNALLCCPQDVERLIIAGAQINTESRFGVSPLQFALDSDDEGLVALLLKYGALVKKNMLKTRQEDVIYRLLKTNYTDQSCCVCYENCDEMTDLFCRNRHPNSFICIDCYRRIKKSKNNKHCPLCSAKLTQYGT